MTPEQLREELLNVFAGVADCWAGEADHPRGGDD